MFKPTPQHSIRLSFNRAFRSPSVINNYLDLSIKGADVPLAALCQVSAALCQAFPVLRTTVLGMGPRAIGSEVARQINPAVPELREESMNAYEIGYTGTIANRTTVGIAFYINDQDDNINFTTTPSVIAANGLPAFFSSRNPPPGWPLPANFAVPVPTPAGPVLVPLLDLPPLRAAIFDRIPATYTYLNLGPTRQKGLELSIDHSFTGAVSGFANYSWQADPEVLDPDAGKARFPIEELSVPPHHRVNAGVNFNNSRFLGSASVNYVGEAYYNDVLASLGFDGFTDAYTMVNATFGMKFNKGRVVATVKGTNLLNEEIRQHIFGDILKRSLTAELRFTF
jgi:outer membrane receptor protein involved in Fe transport